MPEDNLTDLIDVSDVAPVLDEENTDLPEVVESPPPSSGEFMIASFADRFAAFVIDLSFLYALYALALVTFCYIFIEVPPFVIPLFSKQGLIFNSVMLGIFFLYYLISELAFDTTIGKTMCKLSVRMTDGRPLGKFASLLRTILRPIDVIILPINIFLMEHTSWNQKLGDLLSKTVVIKYMSQRRKAYNPTTENLARATGRLIAFLIDLCIFVSFAGGCLLMLNNDQPVMSLFIILFLPLFLIYGIAGTESIFGTTPGKWLFGYIVSCEDGSRIRWSQGIIRTIYRIYDNNIIGFMCIFLGSSKQRPGDAAAGTLVLKQRREIKGLIGFVLVISIAAIIGYAGLQNRDSIIKDKVKPKFLVSFNISRRSVESQIPKRLAITDLKYAVGTPSSIKDSPYFKPGDKIFISFLVDGFAVVEDQPWISQDLTIRYPDGNVAIQLENLVEFKTKLTTVGPVMMENNFELPSSSPVGRYTMVLTVNDKLKSNTLKRHYFFYVTATGASIPSELQNNSEPAPQNQDYSEGLDKPIQNPKNTDEATLGR